MGSPASAPGQLHAGLDAPLTPALALTDRVHASSDKKTEGQFPEKP